MLSKRKIYFRADAGPNIGYGHYIRSLALADMLKQDFDCTMFTQIPTEYQLNEAKDICPVVALSSDDSKFDAFLEYLQGDEIVVLDNYFFTTDYQRAIKAKGCKLVCIDDMRDKHYVADAIINQGLELRDEMFSAEPYTSIYTGIGYSMLRKPFLQNHDHTAQQKGSVVVAFGGSDPHDLTHEYIAMLLAKPAVAHIYAIVGDAYQGKLIMDERVSYCRNLSAQDVSALLTTVEYALLPASTMMREALACGCRILGGYYIDNQEDDFVNYRKQHYIYGLGDFLSADVKQQFAELEISDQLYSGITTNVYDFSQVPNNMLNVFKSLE